MCFADSVTVVPHIRQPLYSLTVKSHRTGPHLLSATWDTGCGAVFEQHEGVLALADLSTALLFFP